MQHIRQQCSFAPTTAHTQGDRSTCIVLLLLLLRWLQQCLHLLMLLSMHLSRKVSM
jgi:hypothetical protein